MMTISKPQHFKLRIEDMKYRWNEDGTVSFSEWTGYGPIIVPFGHKVFLKRGTRKPKFTMPYGKRLLYIDLTEYLKQHLKYFEGDNLPPKPKQLDLFENIITSFDKFINVKLFEDLNNKKTIYHFTESLDSLSDILSDDVLMSGEKTNYGRGYENISFTWNPNLWDIEYMGDSDYRYKVRICFDYERMSKEWKFEPYDYFSEKESEQDPVEQEERVVTDEMNGIIKYITKIYISSEYVKGDMEWLKNRYPEIKFHWARRKKFKN